MRNKLELLIDAQRAISLLMGCAENQLEYRRFKKIFDTLENAIIDLQTY